MFPATLAHSGAPDSDRLSPKNAHPQPRSLRCNLPENPLGSVLEVHTPATAEGDLVIQLFYARKRNVRWLERLTGTLSEAPAVGDLDSG